MTTIRSDSAVSDGAGKHADHAFSYASYDRIVEAFERLRSLNARHGFYERAGDRETYNLGLNQARLSPARMAGDAPPGLAFPFTIATTDKPHPAPARTKRKTLRPRVRVLDENGNELEPGRPSYVRTTNGAHATLNALADALAEGRLDAEGNPVPHLSEGFLPEAFLQDWVVHEPAEGEEAERGQGAALALQRFNLGAQVNPLKLIRGDVVQLGWSKAEPALGQPAFAYGVRRVRDGEVRFVYLSSQPETYGVGVPLNELALKGLAARELGLVFRASLADEDGEPLTDHKYEVEVAGEVFEGRSDAKGKLQINLPTNAAEGTLKFWLDEGTEDEELIEWPLRFKKSQPKEEGADHDGDPEGDPLADDEDDDSSFDGSYDPTAKQASKKEQEKDAQPASEGEVRKEYVVSRSSPPVERYVYHPYEVESPRFVTHALRYGQWQVVQKGEQDHYELFHPWNGSAFTARLNHEFPRYPVALGGTTDLQYTTTTGDPEDGWSSVTLEDTLRRYYRNTERLDGGYFPFGRSRVWHDGIHLEPEEDLRVVAPCDGRIVAARICDYESLLEGEEPRYPYGSPNFVLLKHALEVGGTAYEFFTLLMHLGSVPLGLLGEERILTPQAAQVPWLREIALAPDDEQDQEKYKDLDWKKLYLEVTQVPQGFKLGADEEGQGGTELAVGDFLEVAGPEVDELQWQLYNGRKGGEVKLVRDGTTAELHPEDFLALGGGLMPVDAHPLRYVELKKKLSEGEVVDLWEEKLLVRAGETIGLAGTWHSSARVQVEVFSKDFIPLKLAGAPDATTGEPTMTAKDKVDVDTATDAKVFSDRYAFQEAFFDAVEQRGNEQDGLDGEDLGLRVRQRMLRDVISVDDEPVLLEGEVQAFFNDPDNSLLPLFRNLVVRHLSEWGSKVQWDKLKDAKEQLGDPLEDRLEAIGTLGARYAWWDQGFGEDAGLPADQVAHFYHPITFLRWLEYERQQELAKGQADALHKSVFDLNHDIFGDTEAQAKDLGTQTLRLSLVDEDGDALEGCRYELRVLGELFEGTAGEGGKIQHEVPAEAVEGELTFWLDEDESYTWPLKIR
ncbi:MAG TPA: hypothetical protein DEA08_01930 [Planctomycetes bacterium]|nr:hypothetical protein [Planctomycetota bacterium]